MASQFGLDGLNLKPELKAPRPIPVAGLLFFD